jgi:exonuclease SbcD
MRFLHTSDWHIGRKFHQVDLLNDQATFFDWLVELVKQEKIDCVLVAGDVFDRSNPSTDAVDVANDVFSRLIGLGVNVIVISGNHDSAERLNFGSKAMAPSGLYISTERPDLALVAHPITLERNGEEVQVLPIPYLDPQRLINTLGAEKNHHAVIEAVVKQHIGSLKNPANSIAMAHAFVAGSEESESERQINVGGTANVPHTVFDGLGYVALGHLHRPQKAGREEVVYSGTPLAYSFSEQHKKFVRVIDTNNNMAAIDIEVPVGRPVFTITGTLNDLLESSEHSPAVNGFVRAHLTDENLQLGAMEKLRQRFPYALAMDQIALKAQSALQKDQGESGQRKKPGDIVEDYLQETFGEDLTDTGRDFVFNVVNNVLAGGAE